MERIEVTNSIALKKRFCKDYNLPIVIYDNPYFYERLCTIDSLFDCVDRFEDFCLELSKFNNEQEYFEYYNKVKDEVINYIKSNPEYIGFSESEFKTTTEYGKRNLYVENNDNKTFISLDMKKANFSALQHYSSEIFKNCLTWEKFIKTFTDCEHIINSKYIRQVIMGACNPKKQIKYEHYLMADLLNHLHSNINNINVYSLGEDEIILSIDNAGYSFNQLQTIVKSHPIGNTIRITMFDLHKIKGTDGWLKNIYNVGEHCENRDIVEFKCLNSEIYHQIVKHYYNEVITPNDLVFYHNGKLAAYLEEVDNPWKE